LIDGALRLFLYRDEKQTPEPRVRRVANILNKHTIRKIVLNLLTTKFWWFFISKNNRRRTNENKYIVECDVFDLDNIAWICRGLFYLGCGFVKSRGLFGAEVLQGRR